MLASLGDSCKRFPINWFIESNGIIHLISPKIQFEDFKKKKNNNNKKKHHQQKNNNKKNKKPPKLGFESACPALASCVL